MIYTLQSIQRCLPPRKYLLIGLQLFGHAMKDRFQTISSSVPSFGLLSITPITGIPVARELRQGQDTVVAYAVKFRILAAENGWNKSAPTAVYSKELSKELQLEHACRDE